MLCSTLHPLGPNFHFICLLLLLVIQFILSEIMWWDVSHSLLLYLLPFSPGSLSLMSCCLYSPPFLLNHSKVVVFLFFNLVFLLLSGIIGQQQMALIIVLEMLSNGVAGIKQTIENGSARQSLLLQKGVLQTQVWEQAHQMGSLFGLFLRCRFPPLAPHRLRTTEFYSLSQTLPKFFIGQLITVFPTLIVLCTCPG